MECKQTAVFKCSSDQESNSDLKFFSEDLKIDHNITIKRIIKHVYFKSHAMYINIIEHLSVKHFEMFLVASGGKPE